MYVLPLHIPFISITDSTSGSPERVFCANVAMSNSQTLGNSSDIVLFCPLKIVEKKTVLATLDLGDGQ